MQPESQTDKWAEYRRHRSVYLWLRLAGAVQAIVIMWLAVLLFETSLLRWGFILLWVAVWLTAMFLVLRGFFTWPCPRCGKPFYRGFFGFPSWRCASCGARPPSEEDSSGGSSTMART